MSSNLISAQISPKKYSRYRCFTNCTATIYVDDDSVLISKTVMSKIVFIYNRILSLIF